MDMTMKNKTLKSVAALAAAGAMVFAGAASANALSYTTTPVGGGQQYLTVTSTGSLPAGDYRIGLCTKAVFANGAPFGGFAPACGAMNDVNHPSAGVLVDDTADFLESAIGNEHAFLGGSQPGTFDCSAANTCDVVIVDHVTKAVVEQLTY